MSVTGATDAVTAGVQRMLAEQLAKQMLSSVKPQGGDDDGPRADEVYSTQFAGVLADAMVQGMGK